MLRRSYPCGFLEEPLPFGRNYLKTASYYLKTDSHSFRLNSVCELNELDSFYLVDGLPPDLAHAILQKSVQLLCDMF